MTMSNGESFGCCGHWNTCCAADKGCKYITEDFEFAVLCSVFKHYYINVNPTFIAKWESQVDADGDIVHECSECSVKFKIDKGRWTNVCPTCTPAYNRKISARTTKTQAQRDADLVISKLKGNDSMDDILKLLGL